MARHLALLSALASGLALAACSSVSNDKEGTAPEQAKSESIIANTDTSAPKLSYRYKLAYRLAGDRVAAAQDAHAALCRDAGPDRCQLVAMERSATDDRYPVASLKLRVAAQIAPVFEAGLGKTVRGLDGRATDTNVAADDVSKDLVDTAARIRQRELLVARLTEILRSRQGKLADLVETERSVAQAQEELDKAKGWLAELRSRVAYSDFDIRYEAATPAGSAEGITATLGESAAGSLAMFGAGLRALLALTIFVAPWAALGLGGWWIARIARRRWSPPTG